MNTWIINTWIDWEKKLSLLDPLPIRSRFDPDSTPIQFQPAWQVASVLKRILKPWNHLWQATIHFCVWFVHTFVVGNGQLFSDYNGACLHVKNQPPQLISQHLDYSGNVVCVYSIQHSAVCVFKNIQPRPPQILCFFRKAFLPKLSLSPIISTWSTKQISSRTRKNLSDYWFFHRFEEAVRPEHYPKIRSQRIIPFCFFPFENWPLLLHLYCWLSRFLQLQCLLCASFHFCPTK